MARFNARAIAGVMVVSTLIACNSIIGLSDFNKGDCAGGGACLDDSGILPTDAGGDHAVPNDDGGIPDAGPGASAVSWASWPMPNYTGAEAGSVTVPDLSPTANQTVTDTKTKLVWQQAPSQNPLKYDDAVAACKAAPNGPWRLPKRIELVTLLDYSHGKPFIDQTTFTGFATNATAWTSSEYRTVDDNNVSSVTNQFWTVSFGVGDLELAARTDLAAIAFCVQDLP